MERKRSLGVGVRLVERSGRRNKGQGRFTSDASKDLIIYMSAGPRALLHSISLSEQQADRGWVTC